MFEMPESGKVINNDRIWFVDVPCDIGSVAEQPQTIQHVLRTLLVNDTLFENSCLNRDIKITFVTHSRNNTVFFLQSAKAFNQCRLKDW